jgi:hypothetical protein
VVVPRLSATEAPLEKVLDRVRDISGATVLVNWPALEAAGATKTTPVSFDLSDLTLGKVLAAVLDAASPPNGQLTFYVERNIIRVTSLADADEHLITVSYPVGDLLVPKAVSLSAGTFSTLAGAAPGNAGAAGNTGVAVVGGGGGGGLFQNGNQNNGNNGNNNNNSNTAGANGNTAAVKAEVDANGKAIIDLITGTIRPELWSVNGGKCSARVYETLLIVRAPRSVQDQIGGPKSGARRYGF